MINTVKVTFSHGDFEGFVTYKIRGNNKGLVLLSFDIDDLCNSVLAENEAGFEVTEEDNELWYKMTLKNKNGNNIIVEDELDHLTKYINKIEIVERTEESQ